MERVMVEPASTGYKDWVGTAAAEDSMVKGSGDLHELAGLEPGRWSILAVDTFAHSHGEDPDWHVRIYAFDREAAGNPEFADLEQLAQDRGSVPVREIALHDVDLDDIIRCMKVVHFQLINPHFSTLEIVDRTDHPIQG